MRMKPANPLANALSQTLDSLCDKRQQGSDPSFNFITIF
jgi:hypothetical protein